MPAVRYLVHDVDAVLPFYAALGFREVDRWGPPFAIVERDGLALWLAGPGTSAQPHIPVSRQNVPMLLISCLRVVACNGWPVV